MRWWGFNLAAAVSLLLLVLETVMLWLRGHLRVKSLAVEFRKHPVTSVASLVFIVCFVTMIAEDWSVADGGLLPLAVGLLSLPFWLPAALRDERRSKRRRKGLCLACGYNLTGNTSGVCPECGTPTTSVVKA